MADGNTGNKTIGGDGMREEQEKALIARMKSACIVPEEEDRKARKWLEVRGRFEMH